MRRIAAFVFAVLLAVAALPTARAQDAYPGRPITIISPYAPGGASDFLARTLAEALKARLGGGVAVGRAGLVVIAGATGGDQQQNKGSAGRGDPRTGEGWGVHRRLRRKPGGKVAPAARLFSSSCS